MEKYTIFQQLVTPYTLEPLTCVFCDSTDVTYYQTRKDAYCSCCDNWQANPVVLNPHGLEVNFKNAVDSMDETLLNDLWSVYAPMPEKPMPQELFDAYAALHLEFFEDTWSMVKAELLYELFYGTGGHVGIFPSWDSAWNGACRRLRGNINEKWIDIVDRHSGEASRVVKKPYGDIVLETCPRKYRV